MTVLNKMEVALRSLQYMYGKRELFADSEAGFLASCDIDHAIETLREYESLKGQIAVVPVQTSEARKAALVAVEYCLETIHNPRIPKGDNAIWSSGSSSNPRITEEILETIESALQQPDTSEAVRILVEALEQMRPFQIDDELDRIIDPALNHPAVIAAMKGE